MTDLAELRTFADYHRELADKADALILAMEADPKATPGLIEEPRYQAVYLDGQWGVADIRLPDEWAAFDDSDPDARRDAEESAASLSRGDEHRSAYFWTPRPTA